MRTEPVDRCILPPDGTPFAWAIPERLNIAERCCDSWAATDPDRVALIHVDAAGDVDTWSFARLRDASDRAARAFAERGVGRGDRVGVLLSQGPDFLVASLATWKLGAAVLPLFTLFGPDALRFRLADSGAVLAVADAEGMVKLHGLRDDLPDLKTVLATTPADGAETLAEAMAAATPIEAQAATGPDDPAVLIYTSGTTGPPKGVLHGHRVLIGHLPCFETTHPGVPAAGDVCWTPADWAWIGGLLDLALPSLHYGLPLVSRRMGKFDAAEAWALIARHGITRMFLPPTALKLMRTVPLPEGVAVRSIASGGESLGPDLLDWGRDVLGAPINEIYGQTECNLVICSGEGARRPGSMGLPVPGHEVAVLDRDSAPAASGETGEIAVRRPDPVMFLRYWNQPEKTAEKFRGDWMLTGDLGRADADGFVTYVSRDDDVITSSGYRIGPTEIENCLCSHPSVLMAGVVGLPDPQRTEAVTAFVVLRDGADWEGLEAELIALVRQQVSPHLAPRRVHRRDTLPVTATGKIMRRSLREQAITEQGADDGT